VAEAVAAGPGTAAPPHLPRTGLTPPHLGLGTPRSTSALGLRSPLPRLHRYWAHPCRIGIGDGVTLLHLHRDRVRPRHSAAWLIPATSAGLGSPPPHLRRDWAHPCRICAGTRLGFWSCRRNRCRCTPNAARHAVHAARHRCMRRVALLHAPVPFAYINASRAHAARRGRAPSDGAAEDARRAPVRVIGQLCAADRPTPPRSDCAYGSQTAQAVVGTPEYSSPKGLKYYSSALWFRTTGDRGFGSHHPSERLPTVGCV
jgi:hypothetical protein